MTRYAFVDMHIHTAFSDEPLCDMTIEQLLEKAQTKAKKLGGDCVISIADHNTILGVKKAREILSQQPNKYPNVKLINGIEFTTDLIELTKYFENTRLFTRCHTLAYGYNENDKEMLAYSKITHKFFSDKDNLGMQICSARRAICETYDIYIPFSVLSPMTDLKKEDQFQDVFLSLIEEYFKYKKINIDIKNVQEIIDHFLPNYLSYQRDAESFGRLKVSEIAKLVKDAGGELVIAHPALIRTTTQGLITIAEKENIPLKSIYSTNNNKFNNNTDLGHIKQQKLVLNYFINAFEKACGYKISGIEMYYSSNFESRLDEVVEEVCKERKLYETCGSDYHGVHLHPSKSIGNVLSNQIQNAYKKEYAFDYPDNAPINVSEIASIEHLMSSNREFFANQAVLTAYGKVVEKDIFNKIVNDCCNIKKIRAITKNDQKDVNSLNFSKRIEELISIIEKIEKIYSNLDKPSDCAKLLLRLNLFAENVVTGLKLIKFKSAKYQQLRTNKDYEKIYELIKVINKKFGRLIKHHPQLLKDLKKDMIYYYSKRNVYIFEITNLKLLPPVKELTTTLQNEAIK